MIVQGAASRLRTPLSRALAANGAVATCRGGFPFLQPDLPCRFAYSDEGPPRPPPPGAIGGPVNAGTEGGVSSGASETKEGASSIAGPTVSVSGKSISTSSEKMGSTTFGQASSAGSGAAGSASSPARRPLKAEDLGSNSLRDLGIGGLDAAMDDLFRRVFASRMVPASVAARMGVPHVKGLLMYGPPGTGKTLVARQIGRLLAGDKEPQVVNGPELLQRWVGQSEANIRALFEGAENEYAREGDNAGLYVIIFDEIDALCKARGRDQGGSGVGDSVVNQLLTKLDGVNSAPNVLVIGLTNRKDLLDTALLRPGRLEVQMEIGLPDAAGRQQILKIHTQKMVDNDMLAKCVDLRLLAEATRNFSGAELAGLVRSAASHAYHRLLNPPGHDDPASHGRHGRGLGLGKVELKQEDFEKSLAEITPALGSSGTGLGSKAFQRWTPHGMLPLGPKFDALASACRGLVAQVKGGSHSTPMLTALLEGPPGAGKTAVAATVAAESGFPFTRVLCAADDMVGMSNAERCVVLQKAFDDALASPLSCLVLDNLERILGFSRVGPVYANEVLQTLLLLLRRPPAEGRRLLVIGTTSSADVMQALEVAAAFNVTLHVAPLIDTSEKVAVLEAAANLSPKDAMDAARMLPGEVPIKHLLSTIEMAAAAESFSSMDRLASMEPRESSKPLQVSVAGLKSYLRTVGTLQRPEQMDEHPTSET